MADNVDLYMILAEYEEFFEMKFAKPPKLVRKTNESSAILPKIQKKGSTSLVSAEKKPRSSSISIKSSLYL